MGFNAGSPLKVTVQAQAESNESKGDLVSWGNDWAVWVLDATVLLNEQMLCSSSCVPATMMLAPVNSSLRPDNIGMMDKMIIDPDCGPVAPESSLGDGQKAVHVLIWIKSDQSFYELNIPYI